TAETAKSVDSKPASIATLVVSAVIPAECELGIPPVDVRSFQSSFLLRNNCNGTLINCAKKMAVIEIQRGKFKRRLILLHPFPFVQLHDDFYHTIKHDN